MSPPPTPDLKSLPGKGKAFARNIVKQPALQVKQMKQKAMARPLDIF
jgi:hypothetical protein